MRSTGGKGGPLLAVVGDHWIVNEKTVTPAISRRIEAMLATGYLKYETKEKDCLYYRIAGTRKEYDEAVEKLLSTDRPRGK